MWYFHQKLSDSQKNPEQTQTLPLPKPQQNAKIPLLEQSWMCLWNVCQQEELVGRATYRLCTCRYFASGILTGSSKAGICQHEIFSLLVLCGQLSVTLATSWRRILSIFEWLLSLRWDDPHWKSEPLSLLSIVTLREWGLLAPLICLNRQTLDFQVKVKWVYSHEKIKVADIQKLHSF